MPTVGLLYVGAVLCVNGLVLLGLVPARGASVLNLLVGAMQVVFPTVMLAQAGGDPGAVLAASGLYLFGFTYLWVGAASVFGLPTEGFGWFSLYVAAGAAAFGGIALGVQAEPVSAVAWWLWAALWFLFFLLDARGRAGIRASAGWFALFCGLATCAVPAFLQLAGAYSPTPEAAVLLAVAGGAALALALTAGRAAPRRTPSGEPAPADGGQAAAVAPAGAASLQTLVVAGPEEPGGEARATFVTRG